MKVKVFRWLPSLYLAATLPLNAALADTVVLERGDITVTTQDIYHYIQTNTPEAQRNSILKRPGIVREMAENIYIIRTLSEAALQTDDIDHELLDWAIALDAGRRRMDALLSQQVNATLAAVDWEKAAREVYAADGDKFVQPEQVRAEHILIGVEGRTEEEAAALARELRSRALAGESFSDLASEYSDDPSAATNRGDLGFFARGAMVPAFEEVAFALTTPGELGEPVRSPFGFHVIRLVERRTGGKQAFDTVKPQIVSELERQTRQKLRQDQLMAIRSVPDMVWNDAALDALTAELGATSRLSDRPRSDAPRPVER
jgi:peptidyl-prolyl cis-trans isomerase C